MNVVILVSDNKTLLVDGTLTKVVKLVMAIALFENAAVTSLVF
jgi:hypothetical protein